jgi:hypothetical protein
MPVVHVHVKVVPGASRDMLVGPHGDRLKVKVAAPPEGGRANEAVIRLLAGALRVDRRSVRLIRGHTAALKSFEIRGLSADAVGRLLYGEDR